MIRHESTRSTKTVFSSSKHTTLSESKTKQMVHETIRSIKTVVFSANTAVREYIIKEIGHQTIRLTKIVISSSNTTVSEFRNVHTIKKTERERNQFPFYS